MTVLIIGKGKMGMLYYNILTEQKICEVLIANRISNEELSTMQGQINGVVICTPYEFHYPYALMALRNGINAFVEKPLSCSFKESLELTNLANQNSLVLVVGQTLRFCLPMIKAKQIMLSEENQIKSIDIKRMSIKKDLKEWWRNQARFLLLFEGIHSIDLINYFFNSNVNLVNYSLSYTDNRFVGDSGFDIALTSNEIEISIVHKIVEKHAINQIHLYGSRYDLIISDYAVLKRNEDVLLINSTSQTLATAYRYEMNEFLKAIRKESADVCKGDQVLPSMDIIERIYSANEKIT